MQGSGGDIQRVPKGTISVRTKPSPTERGAYESFSQDLNLPVRLYAPDGARIYIDGVARDGDSFTPCIIEKRHSEMRSHYMAKLMCPPDITKDSEYFMRDLFIPTMRMNFAIGGIDDPTGFFMISDYLPDQTLYCPLFDKVREHRYMRGGVEYQGYVVETNKHVRKYPKVFITMNSVDHGSVFDMNRDAMRLLRASDANYWWDYEICDDGKGEPSVP